MKKAIKVLGILIMIVGIILTLLVAAALISIIINAQKVNILRITMSFVVTIVVTVIGVIMIRISKK